MGTVGSKVFAAIFRLMLHQTIVSHIVFMNTKPIIKMCVTTDLVITTKTSRAGLFSITCVNSWYQKCRERIGGVASTQASMMANTKWLGLHWRLIWGISYAHNLCHMRVNLETSLLKWLWILLSRVADLDRPNPIKQKMDIAEYAKALRHRTTRIPLLQKVTGMTHTLIHAGLGHRTPKMALIVQHIGGTFRVNTHEELAVLVLYWGLVQWLVEQVRTSWTFPLFTVHPSTEITVWHLSLTLTLCIKMILCCAQFRLLSGYRYFTIHCT